MSLADSLGLPTKRNPWGKGYCIQTGRFDAPEDNSAEDFPVDTCFAEVVAALEHFGTLTSRTYALIPTLLDSLGCKKVNGAIPLPTSSEKEEQC